MRTKPVIADWQFTLGAIATNILDDVRWIDPFIPFTHSSFYDCSSFCKQALCLEIAKDIVYGELACRRLHENPENKPEGLCFSRDIFERVYICTRLVSTQTTFTVTNGIMPSLFIFHLFSQKFYFDFKRLFREPTKHEDPIERLS